ncbi:hypothetical protein [Ruminococcus flavefaciens]|uniref:Uncharacterized membrane protein YgcG, contains a TPM-fold domain n=1 Tax=Ruminococcus flavefaciens TaxID=1265 RepID=A0A1M7KBV1_RUMFL|nr:hypothetical protein [Ruminococcus flavefaciens]SHM62473.1 Uncharacterized membrane protein YgcG, contains a TPM-fold domain [Ruminococcus flavefaciens]
MMKRLFSLIAAFVICMCLLPLSVLDAHAADNDYQGWDGNWRASKLVDKEYGGSGLFSKDNRDTLEEKIQTCAKDLEMNILVYIGGNAFYSDDAVQSFCNDTYDMTFGNDTDGILYYIDLSGQSPARDCISTAGKAMLLYEKSKDEIFDHLDNYLPSSEQAIYESDIYNAVDSFLNQLRYYSENQPSSFTYYHDKNTGRYIYYQDGELMITTKKPLMLWMYIFLVCLAIGGIVGLITYFVAKNNYKFKNKTNPSIYLTPDNVRFTEKSDTLIRSYVTKHKIETSSGGGGGSRGGGGGGFHGGSHGGGVHHR